MRTVELVKRIVPATRGVGLVLWVLLLLPAVGRAQVLGAEARFEVTGYNIEAELFPATHMLTAKVRINFTPRADVTSLRFDLHSALRVEEALDAAGKPLRFRQEGLAFQVDFLNPVVQGKPTAITVRYGGPLASAEGSPAEGLKLAYVGPEGSYLLYPGRWFPVSEYRINRFAATVRITVPSDETVIASGKPLAPVRDVNKVTYGFQYDERSFPGTVVAGKYAVQPATAAGADITLFLKPGHEEFAAGTGDAAAKIQDLYSEKFGGLSNPHVSIVEIDDGTVGGYAAPGLVVLASRAITNPANYRLLAHEMARLWWPCTVSPATLNDLFLDAGLAAYSAAMYVQSSAGEAAFESVMNDTAVGALTHEDVAPVSQAARLVEFTPEYQSIVVQKGAMVFHMLRWVIGEDAFLDTMRTLVKNYAGKGVTTDEFQRLAEEVSKQELTYFFAQWVSSTGVPQFKRSWATYRVGEKYQVMGKVQQDLDIFRMPVEIRIIPEGGKAVTERVEMVGTTADFTVTTRTRPLRVVVDPASRLLKYDDKMKLQVEMARGDQLRTQQAYLEAIKQYQVVLGQNASSSLAHYRIGEVLFTLRNYTASMESFRAALNGDLDPKWIEVWSHVMLGKIFDVTGQRDRALNEYQRALQLRDNTQGALDEANRHIQKAYSEASRTQ